MTETGKNLLAPLAVLASVLALCVGSSYAKALFPVLGAEGVTAYRVGFSAIMLCIFWRPWRFKLAKTDIRRIVLYGISLGLMNLSFYLAIRTLPVGIAIALEFTGPLVLAVCSSRRIVDFVWIAFAVSGTLLLLPLHHDIRALDSTGVFFIFCAAFFWALYIILGRKAGETGAGPATSLGLLTAAVLVVPFGIAKAGSALLSPQLIVSGLSVALLSSAIPYSLEMYALKRLPNQTFGILLSSEPAVGAAAAWLILGESLTTMQLLAILCIIIASVGSTATIRREKTLPNAQTDLIAP